MKKAVLDLIMLHKATKNLDVNGNYIDYTAMYETRDYGMFQSLTNNREVNSGHVKTMGASVTQLHAILRFIVVVRIKGVHYIADGQHLFAYLKSVGLPIRYFLVEANNQSEAMQIVSKLNSSSRNWGIKNFVEAWCGINKDYNVLQQFQKMYGLTYTTLAALLTNNTIANAKRQITSGNFQVTDKEDAIRRLQAIELFYNTTGMDRSQYATIGLINYMANIGVEKYMQDEKKFLNCVTKGINRNAMKGRTFGRKDDYVAFFNECRNK